MNKPQLLTVATVVVALAGAIATGSAVAAEGEQFVPPTGTLTRAEVKAELQRPRAQSGIVQLGEATQFADAPASRSRAEVAAEARAAAGSTRGNDNYVGS